MRNFAIAIKEILFALCLLTIIPIAIRADELPANLGLGLKNLVEAQTLPNAKPAAKTSASPALQSDESGRVTVNIHLNGQRVADEVARDLEALGLEILLVDSSWRNGVISARLPLDQATAVAQLPGVRSVLLAPKPRTHVGRVTAESSVVDRAKAGNTPGIFTSTGILGRGISVGIVSDSYDTAPNVPRASVAVASGDLPGPGNPDGYTQNVAVIADDFAPNDDQTDEGRGMAEIIHDLAPAAKLAFSAAGATQSTMASSIRNLRSNPAAACDVIVDDISFADEPIFSDGQIALAIEDVVTSTSLAGKKVAYFSAAGNEGNFAYTSDLQLVSAAQGLAANSSQSFQLRFNQVPQNLYAGGFHNFDTTGGTRIATPLSSSGSPYLVFQWDDPFDRNAITTDYNLLIFSSTGQYLASISGVDNNFATDEPIETASLDADQTYYVVISLAAPTSGTPVARHLKFVSFSGDDISGPDIAYGTAAMSGHASAASANAVGAYAYNTAPDEDSNYNPDHTSPPPGPYRPSLESFTSNGGSLPFYFSASGQRLSSPQLRSKPEFSAADGVNTTFFGTDSDNDTFPNFFGTSASAPTAAGIAALLLEAAGGPQSLTPAQIRTKLQETAMPHDLDPFICVATAQRESATVTITAHGDGSNASANDPNFFTVTFNGLPTERLLHLEIDLSNAGLVFDDASGSGSPFTVGSNPNNITVAHTVSADHRILSLDFGNFTPGASISFGIDRDLASINASGNSADALAGASIRALRNSPGDLIGAFGNQLGNGYAFPDGFGLIDARKAVASILGNPAPPSGVPVNVSTRGFIGAGDNALIGGIIIQGNGNKQVVFRALGPSLTARGVSGALQDPTLALFDSNGTQTAADDNWQDDPNQAAQIQSAGFAPSDLRESALLATLAPSSYTVIVRGNGNTVGNGLVEAYDLDTQPAAARLANVSTRGFVQPGDSVLIGGFIVRTDSANVIARGLGPSLPNAGALQDPTLEVVDVQGNSLAGNDNWQQPSGQPVDIQAAGLAPTNASESAISLTLTPGAYTAVLRGQGNSSGIGLVEIYNVR